MAYRHRIFLRDLYKRDADKGESNVRKLEMLVDAIVSFEPAYGPQFFKDCGLYGIDEAKTYLINFVEKNYQSPDDLAADIAALSVEIEALAEKFRVARTG